MWIILMLYYFYNLIIWIFVILVILFQSFLNEISGSDDTSDSERSEDDSEDENDEDKDDSSKEEVSSWNIILLYNLFIYSSSWHHAMISTAATYVQKTEKNHKRIFV